MISVERSIKRSVERREILGIEGTQSATIAASLEKRIG